MAARIGLDVGSDTVKTVILHENGAIEPLEVMQVQGQPIRRVKEALEWVLATGIRESVLCGVTGAGAAARNSIGLVLVGGMAVGTIFTLFVIPSIYMLVARDHSKDRGHESTITTTM